MIPQADLRAALLADEPEISEAIARVKRSGWFILGPEVEAFENEFAAWIGARFAVGVANGTDAIALALRACGVGPGTSVVTVSHTVSATVAAVEQAGATPVLIDIDPRTMTMDAAELAEVLRCPPGGPVVAVVPVHIYGQPADLRAIQGLCTLYGARLVDDCAHAFGATIDGHRVGSRWADISCFSFYPTKNLACLGDGGAITTNDALLADRVRSLRQYCWGDQRYVSAEPGGVDSRLDELQAAILRVRLKNLDNRQNKRAEIASRYDDALRWMGRLATVGHANHLYVVRMPKRLAFQVFMGERGIMTNVHFPVPVHMQPAYAGRVGLGPSECVESLRASMEVVTLPLYPEMTECQVEHVCEALTEWRCHVA